MGHPSAARAWGSLLLSTLRPRQKLRPSVPNSGGVVPAQGKETLRGCGCWPATPHGYPWGAPLRVEGGIRSMGITVGICLSGPVPPVPRLIRRSLTFQEPRTMCACHLRRVTQPNDNSPPPLSFLFCGAGVGTQAPPIACWASALPPSCSQPCPRSPDEEAKPTGAR